MNIIKTSGYLDKSKRLKITNQILITCIYLDEKNKKINWNNVKTESQLVSEIEKINKKEKVSNIWARVLLNPNVIHNFNNDEGFLYIALNCLADKEVDADEVCLEILYENLKTTKETGANKILLTYKDILNAKKSGAKKYVDFDSIIKNKTGWVLIAGEQNNQIKYEEDIRNLSNIFNEYIYRELFLNHISQDTGWCTGKGMEKTYLPRGDFWKYLVNGKAKLSIRFEGDTIKEMQGLNNNNKNAYKFCEKYIELSQKYPELKIQESDSGYGLNFKEIKIADEKIKFYEKNPMKIIENFESDFYYLTDDFILKHKDDDVFIKKAISYINSSDLLENFCSKLQNFPFLRNEKSIIEKENEFLKEYEKECSDPTRIHYLSEKNNENIKIFTKKYKSEIDDIYIGSCAKALLKRPEIFKLEYIEKDIREKHLDFFKSKYVSGIKKILKENPFFISKISEEFEPYIREEQAYALPYFKKIIENYVDKYKISKTAIDAIIGPKTWFYKKYKNEIKQYFKAAIKKVLDKDIAEFSHIFDEESLNEIEFTKEEQKYYEEKYMAYFINAIKIDYNLYINKKYCLPNYLIERHKEEIEKSLLFLFTNKLKINPYFYEKLGDENEIVKKYKKEIEESLIIGYKNLCKNKISSYHNIDDDLLLKYEKDEEMKELEKKYVIYLINLISNKARINFDLQPITILKYKDYILKESLKQCSERVKENPQSYSIYKKNFESMADIDLLILEKSFFEGLEEIEGVCNYIKYYKDNFIDLIDKYKEKIEEICPGFNSTSSYKNWYKVSKYE